MSKFFLAFAFLGVIVVNGVVTPALFAQSKSADDAFNSLDREEQHSAGSVKQEPPKAPAVNSGKLADTHAATNENNNATVQTQSPITKQLENTEAKTSPSVYIVHDFKITMLDLSGYKVVGESHGEFTAVVTNNYLVSPETAYVAVYSASDLKLGSDFGYDGVPTPGCVRAKITPDGKKMYVGAPGWGKASLSGLFVIDLEKKKQDKILYENNIGIGFIGMSDDGKYIYANAGKGLAVINTFDDSVYKQVSIGDKQQIDDILSAGNSAVYVVTHSYTLYSDDDYKFSVIDINRGITKTINLNPGQYKVFRLQLSPDEKYVYILGDNKLRKFDTNKNSLIDERDFNYWAAPSAISPDGKLLFVKAINGNNVEVYDIKDNIVVKEIPFEKDLYDIIVK